MLVRAVPAASLSLPELAELAEPREAERVAQGRIDGLAPSLQTPVHPGAMEPSVGLGVAVAVVVVTATPDLPATRPCLTATLATPGMRGVLATSGVRAIQLRLIVCQ